MALHHLEMDDHTFQNWVKVKQALEASGKTNCEFYRRACEVVRSRRDPGPRFV